MKKLSTPESIQQSGQECEILANGNTRNESFSTYDKASENKLFKMISLSRQPIIPEFNHEISLLVYKLVNNPNGFYDLINGLYGNFIDDLHNYIEGCKIENKPKEFIPVLSGLLFRFTKEQERFNQTDALAEYKENADVVSPPATNTVHSSSNADYAHKATRFNHEAGFIQIECINRGVAEIGRMLEQLQLSPKDLDNINHSKKGKADTNHLKNSNESKPPPDFVKNSDYKFTVLKEEAFDVDVTLSSLYDGLKQKYLKCTFKQFYNVFLTANPTPTVWLKSFSSLSYMIRLMKGKYIETTGNISIYKVATKYFHQGEIGQYFKPQRFKCETKDVSRHDKDDLDKIFKYLRTKSKA